MQNNFSLLIKPASADCNLNCAYCFYLEKHRLFPQSLPHKMSQDVLERMISSYLHTEQKQHVFGWQGGEPLLMGIDFFMAATKLQQKHGARGADVANGLQTNGVLLNDDFARHFSRFNFLLGVSLDGPAEVHDAFRRNRAGGPSHAEVVRGIECLKRNEVEYNVLTLVTSANVARAREVLAYLCEAGHLFQQYVPCVEFDERGVLQPYAILGEAWGDFLCALFDEWVKIGPPNVSIRFFDSILQVLVSGDAALCHMNRSCCQYFVVEHNGDVYPCDFFVEENLKIGNVMQTSWKRMIQSPLYRSFGHKKIEWNGGCEACEYVSFCAGDCPKHRVNDMGIDSRARSWLCEGYKRFFGHALPGFRNIAAAGFQY